MQKRCAKIRYYEHDINSTDRSKELAIVTVAVLLMFLRVDGHAHPGMDTALKFGGLSLGHQGASCAGVSSEKDIVWARRLCASCPFSICAHSGAGTGLPDAAFRGATNPPPNSR